MTPLLASNKRTVKWRKLGAFFRQTFNSTLAPSDTHQQESLRNRQTPSLASLRHGLTFERREQCCHDETKTWEGTLHHVEINIRPLWVRAGPDSGNTNWLHVDQCHDGPETQFDHRYYAA
ncbi:MAG: hypothetical protein Aurels2KO_17190 [Aureliella sp.]